MISTHRLRREVTRARILMGADILQSGFDASMADDLNTPKALRYIHDAASILLSLPTDLSWAERVAVLRLRVEMMRCLNCLGLPIDRPKKQFKEGTLEGLIKILKDIEGSVRDAGLTECADRIKERVQ